MIGGGGGASSPFPFFIGESEAGGDEVFCLSNSSA